MTSIIRCERSGRTGLWCKKWYATALLVQYSMKLPSRGPVVSCCGIQVLLQCRQGVSRDGGAMFFTLSLVRRDSKYLFTCFSGGRWACAAINDGTPCVPNGDRPTFIEPGCFGQKSLGTIPSQVQFLANSVISPPRRPNVVLHCVKTGKRA